MEMREENRDMYSRERGVKGRNEVRSQRDENRLKNGIDKKYWLAKGENL